MRAFTAGRIPSRTFVDRAGGSHLTSRKMSSLLLSTLGIVCSACDRLNAARSAKCAACGAPLLSISAPVKPAEVRPAPSAHVPSPHSSAKVSPLVDSVLAAQAHARPKPPVLVARKGEPSPRPGPKRHPPLPVAAPPNLKPSVGKEPIPANELIKKRPAVPAGATVPSAFVLTVVAGNGMGQHYRVPVSGCWIGRNRGNILFPEDSFVSAHHATLTVHQGTLRIRDEGSASGLFVAIAGQETISHGTLFNIGRRLFRYLAHLKLPPSPAAGQPRIYGAPLPQGQAPYAVEEVLVGGRSGRAAISGAPLLTIGQMNCDLSYPQDEDLASRHCELAPAGQGAVLRDLSGVLGTFVRIAPGFDRQLNAGDRIRIGQQLLQVEAA
jgi:pSer/pThr/pTyr-binding forkhead associated (FHA) protein